MKFALSLWFMLVLTNDGLAQDMLESFGGTGFTIKNSRRYPSLSPTGQVGFSFSKEKTDGIFSKCYPNIRVWHGLVWQTLGNMDTLGQGFGYFPSLEKKLVSKNRIGLYLRLGMGGAYVTKYNNKILGSNLQFMGVAQLTADYKLLGRWSFLASLGVVHLSNGGFNTPNVGVNVVEGNLGLRYSFKVRDKEIATDTIKMVFSKKIKPYIRYGIGLHQQDGWDSDVFAHYFHVGIERKISRVSVLRAGLEATYSPALRFKQEQIGVNNGSETIQATRFSFNAGYQLLLGHLAFLAEGGIYLNKHFDSGSILMTRIGMEGYLKNTLNEPKSNISLGFFARTYFGLAEMVELSISYRF